jgi:hypothetical protein
VHARVGGMRRPGGQCSRRKPQRHRKDNSQRRDNACTSPQDDLLGSDRSWRSYAHRNPCRKVAQHAFECNIGLVRLKLFAAFAVTVLGAAAIGAASDAQTRPDSGIRGLALYGPTCPVVRPGQTCVKPYAAWLTIRREPKGTIVARVHAGSDGRFTVRVRAGHYLVVPHNGKPFPRAQSQAVSVHRHHFTAVTVHFESGIR